MLVQCPLKKLKTSFYHKYKREFMTTIIAFAGRKQSGKTTSSEFVRSVIQEYSLGSCKIYNFADALKQDICINILGLSYDQCYGDDIAKNSLTEIRWENVLGYKDLLTNENDYHSSGFMTARQIMQIVGTDIFRRMKHNVWAEATIKKITNEKYDFAIIADCRFPNEVSAIKQAGGYVIKLMLNPHDSNHASEVSLDAIVYDQSNFDLVIDNSTLSVTEKNENIIRFLENKGMLLS